MPTLAKLLDCLKWPKARAAGQPVAPRGEVCPVADPELSFGWQGYLFSNPAPTTGNIPANTVGASITIPDDCFYLVDAAGLLTEQITAITTIPLVRRIALEILDVGGVIAWQLARTWIGGNISGGQVTQVDGGDIQLKLHLLQGMVIRWKTLDAGTGVSGIFSSSISLRKLYEETL